MGKTSVRQTVDRAMKVAIYARYSSTLQEARSVDDQVNICRERADREGWEVVEVFADYAISGAVRDRPGLNAMLARAGEFDLILAEAIDRISRHQGDSAYIFEEMKFAGCKLITLSEGEISELHIGLKGTMAALFRADLADKIRRGQRGRVAASRIPGGICYGYRKVVRLDGAGNPELGLREIDPEQGEVVRHIYREFLAGVAPRAIAGRLNREGVPAPRGGLWRMSMINGDRIRQNGILQNEIYAGVLVYNRTRMVRDPSTRKRVPRVNPADQWVRKAIPELRIVDQASWAAVRALRAGSVGVPVRDMRRPRRLLSGLVRCGICGGPYIIVSQDYWACGRHRDSRACDNGRKVRTVDLENRVLAGLKSELLDPEVVRLFVIEYHEGYARGQAKRSAARAALEARLVAIAVKVDRLVMAIANGAGAIEEVVQALSAAKAERETVEREIADIDALPVIALHPTIAQDYRLRVETLTDAVADPEASAEAFPAIRSLIDSVEILPRAEERGVDIEVTGFLANIIALATGAPLSVGSNSTFHAVAEARYALNSRTALASAIMRVRV